MKEPKPPGRCWYCVEYLGNPCGPRGLCGHPKQGGMGLKPVDSEYGCLAHERVRWREWLKRFWKRRKK